eukprot:COSAG05_NODE_1257_length_5359_cov_5.368251_1_plen_204_part_00
MAETRSRLRSRDAESKRARSQLSRSGGAAGVDGRFGQVTSAPSPRRGEPSYTRHRWAHRPSMSSAPKVKRRIRRGSVNDNDREFRAKSQAGADDSYSSSEEGGDGHYGEEYLTLDSACAACAHLGPAVQLSERAVLYTADTEVPAELRSFRVGKGGGAARISKSTYAANDPNEDRNTIAIGENFLFAGVWDGCAPLRWLALLL